MSKLITYTLESILSPPPDILGGKRGIATYIGPSDHKTAPIDPISGENIVYG